MIRGSVNTVAARFWRRHKMERRLLLAILIGGFLTIPPLNAQDVSQTGIFETTLLVSYRSSMSFTTQTELQASGPRIVLDEGAAFGFGAGIHVRRADSVEFRWMRQNSFARIEDAGLGIPKIQTTLDQFHCDFMHEYVPKPQGPQVAPFMMASVGATSLKGEPNAGSTHFSVGIGGGLKFFMSPHLGFRVQAEWLPVFVGPRTPALCGPGCTLHLGGALGSQVEIAIGPVLRF